MSVADDPRREHEQDVQFEVTPGETADPAAGFFSSAGEAFVTVGFDPVYTIRVYHDKDGSGVWGGNDPFVDATVVTPVAIDHLRIFIDAVEWAPGEIANGEIMVSHQVTARGAWSGLDGEPFTGDDVIMDEVPITAAELNTVLADSPYPGGGPTAVSAISPMSQRNAVRPPAPPAGPPGGSPPGLSSAAPPGLTGASPPGLPAGGPPGLGGEPVPGVGNPVNSPAVTQKRIFDIFPVGVESYEVTLTAIHAGTCDVEFTYVALDSETGTPLRAVTRLVGFKKTEPANIDLQISNGLEGYSGGQEIKEADEETVGAVTVANLNDTDGDGKIDRDDNDVSVAGKDPKGRNEIDLMKLDIEKPTPASAIGQGDKVTLKIVSGDVALWEKSTKGTLILVNAANNTVEFDPNDLPKTIWVEARAASTALRGIVLTVTFKSASDTVKATGVWAELTRVFHQSISEGGTKDIPPTLDDADARKLIEQMRSPDGSLFGVGTFPSAFPHEAQSIGGKILHEWKVLPSGGQPEGVVFDVTRQIAARNRLIASGSGDLVMYPEIEDVDFPELSSPPRDIETPNDDKATFGEDNIPSNDLVYDFDPPSSFDLSGGYAYFFRRDSFRAWVRVQFGGRKFQNALNVVEGSRSSNVSDWHYAHHLRAKGNGRWEFDSGNPSVSAPGRWQTGGSNGTLSATVGSDAIREGFTARYEQKTGTWTLTRTTGGAPVSSTIPPPVKTGEVWTLPVPTIVELRIVEGDKPFGPASEIRFSTFRTALTPAVKLFEIGPNAIDHKAGP